MRVNTTLVLGYILVIFCMNRTLNALGSELHIPGGHSGVYATFNTVYQILGQPHVAFTELQKLPMKLQLLIHYGNKTTMMKTFFSKET